MCCKDAESRVFSLVALDALRLKIFMTIFAPEERLSTSATLIGSSQKKRFDVRIQELVSKVQNSGGFSRNNVFRVDYHFSIKSFAPFWPFLAILSRIHALFGAPFTGLTSEVVPQN